MSDIKKKRQKEQIVVRKMITLYCWKNHQSRHEGELCSDCQELLDYAMARSEKCPFMENKTFCSNCRVHCYEGANSYSHAFFRAENAVVSSHTCRVASDMQRKGKKKDEG